ncbi:AGAP004004-PA-like protein [Anopheles sinensis]|uniref:AGAP004004-PA-like protein n=1 Tax=Anopheles sinensis TaxID=74873 RepID=A0A084VWK2_ANOSI|nr:AGAP004004-PA-like protein [Anopheles sinensis]
MFVRRSCFIVLGVYGLALVVGHTNPTADVVKSRQKRIVFPLNGAMGIIFAIAVPLGIPDRNIFMSYNFEGNYNSPADANIFTEGFGNYIKGIVEPLTAPSRPVESYGIRKRSVEKRDDQTPVTAQITRRQIYKMLRKQLKGQHFHGKKCLLRMICDAALHPFRETNGVIGDLVQIMLSPSTSMDENLPKEYLMAEVAGSNGSCDRYRTDCPKDPLEFVSFMTQ